MDFTTQRALTNAQKKQFLNFLKIYTSELLDRRWNDQSPESVHSAANLVQELELDLYESMLD